MSVFPKQTRKKFVDHYPEQICELTHDLGNHPLMTLDSLSKLADFLPEKSIECYAAEQPIGVGEKPSNTGRSPAETILDIANAKSWVGLRQVEQHPEYKQLLHDLLAELRPEIEKKTGAMMKLESYIFITSAGGTTPFHFDPEHNILLHIRGEKVMNLLPAGDARFVPHEMHERYHRGGGAELVWQDDFMPEVIPVPLEPGDAVYVPVMAPHFVKNGQDVSISLSITWRSEWSFGEADARALNSVLRKFGMDPKPPKRWPAHNTGKAIAWRIARRIPGFG